VACFVLAWVDVVFDLILPSEDGNTETLKRENVKT
jgi:hypothetical protein